MFKPATNDKKLFFLNKEALVGSLTAPGAK